MRVGLTRMQHRPHEAAHDGAHTAAKVIRMVNAKPEQIEHKLKCKPVKIS
jgi:hypothetical protein